MYESLCEACIRRSADSYLLSRHYKFRTSHTGASEVTLAMPGITGHPRDSHEVIRHHVRVGRSPALRRPNR